MGEGFPVKSEPENLYALSGKIMLIVVVVLLGLLLVMACLQLYARWHVLRLRRRQRRTGQAHVVHYANGSNHPGSAVDRGLELWILNSLPVFLYTSKAEAAEQTLPECAVCLSEFEEDEFVRLLPKCGHSFHVDCVGMWLHSHSTCPICRSPIEPVASHTGPSSTAEEEDEGASESDPDLSSWTGLCETCQHDEANSNSRSFWGRRRAIAGGILGIRTEAAPPPRPDEVVNELPRSSPLLSLKRLLSISRKLPHAAEGTSGGAAQLDLEGGLSEPIQTIRGVNSE